MEEIARVYAEALFDVAKDKGKLDEIHEQLGQFADAIAANRDLQVFLFSPYFSSSEKREGIEPGRLGGTRARQLPRAAGGEAPDAGDLPDPAPVRRDLGQGGAALEVTLTSAVELPPDLVDEVRKQIEKQTGQTIELETDVDENVLGGMVLQVGNMVLDASVRNKLERLRKEVANAA